MKNKIFIFSAAFILMGSIQSYALEARHVLCQTREGGRDSRAIVVDLITTTKTDQTGLQETGYRIDLSHEGANVSEGSSIGSLMDCEFSAGESLAYKCKNKSDSSLRIESKVEGDSVVIRYVPNLELKKENHYHYDSLLKPLVFKVSDCSISPVEQVTFEGISGECGLDMKLEGNKIRAFSLSGEGRSWTVLGGSDKGSTGVNLGEEHIAKLSPFQTMSASGVKFGTIRNKSDEKDYQFSLVIEGDVRNPKSAKVSETQWMEYNKVLDKSQTDSCRFPRQKYSVDARLVN